MGKPNPDPNKAELSEIEQLRTELAAAKEKLAEYEQGYWGRLAGRNRREANNLRILLRDVVNGKTHSLFEGNLEDRIEAALSVDVEPNAAIERDERAEYENHPCFKGMDFTRAPEAPDYYMSPYANGGWDGWRHGRAALERKPS
ncbi:hypothetical protein ACT2UN_000871 [Pseudomonas putida]